MLVTKYQYCSVLRISLALELIVFDTTYMGFFLHFILTEKQNLAILQPGYLELLVGVRAEHPVLDFFNGESGALLALLNKRREDV
jgi:hypothetical protein